MKNARIQVRIFSGPYIPTEETPYSDGKNWQKFSFHAVAKKAEFILRWTPQEKINDRCFVAIEYSKVTSIQFNPFMTEVVII